MAKLILHVLHSSIFSNICIFTQGEGTREGTGKCNCDSGYQGDLCDECKDAFFEESKNDTHITCTGKSLITVWILNYKLVSNFSLKSVKSWGRKDYLVNFIDSEIWFIENKKNKVTSGSNAHYSWWNIIIKMF